MVSVSGFRSWRPKEMGRHDSTRSTILAASVHARVMIALVRVQRRLHFLLELTRTPLDSIHDGPLRAVCRLIMIYKHAS